MSGKKRDAGTGSVYFEAARKRWVGEVVLDDRKRRVTARTKVDASAKLAELIRDHAGGTVALDGSATVASALEIWRDRVLPGRDLSTSSVENYRWVIDLLDAELGKVRLRSLTAERIEAALDRLAAGSQGRPLGARSLKYVRSTLAQVLDTAIRRKMVATNWARVAELTATAAKPAARKSLDIDGARRLWDALLADGSSAAACFALQLVTGLRPGEAAGVCFDAVDLERRHLVVRRGVRNDARGVARLVEELKTAGSFRTIALPAAAVELLRSRRAAVAAMRLAASSWIESDLVFPSTTGRPLDGSARRSALAAICAEADLPRLTPHELRHTAASVLSDQGIPLEVIADLLGHASTRVLEETYRHRLRVAADGAVAVFDGLLGSPSSTVG